MVVAIAQEDEDLASHARILSGLRKRSTTDEVPFEVVADVDRVETPGYDRTTTYLIDLDGVVREVFPAMIHMRPTWTGVLHRLDEIRASDD